MPAAHPLLCLWSVSQSECQSVKDRTKPVQHLRYPRYPPGDTKLHVDKDLVPETTFALLPSLLSLLAMALPGSTIDLTVPICHECAVSKKHLALKMSVPLVLNRTKIIIPLICLIQSN